MPIVEVQRPHFYRDGLLKAKWRRLKNNRHRCYVALKARKSFAWCPWTRIKSRKSTSCCARLGLRSGALNVKLTETSRLHVDTLYSCLRISSKKDMRLIFRSLMILYDTFNPLETKVHCACKKNIASMTKNAATMRGISVCEWCSDCCFGYTCDDIRSMFGPVVS